MVTREDLPQSAMAVQSAHAAIDFQYQYPELANTWHDSNYLIFLKVKDELSLIKLIDKSRLNNIKITIFREPDLDNQITAIAFEPSEESNKITNKIKLM